jgi:hypothetical protein
MTRMSLESDCPYGDSSSHRRIDKSIQYDDASISNGDDVEARDLGWFTDWAVAPGLASDIVKGLRSAGRCEHEARKLCVQIYNRLSPA